MRQYLIHAGAIAGGVVLILLTGIALLARSGVRFTSLQPSMTLNIRARIDGISHLVLKEDTARWYHRMGSAPGRWIEAPTRLDGAECNPTWLDVPDRGNHNCQCFSSTYTGLPTLTDHPPVLLKIVQARGKVFILQQPSPENEFTLIVAFGDVILPDQTYGDEMV